MPLLFVHGVNTRRGREYDEAVDARNALFRRAYLPAFGLPGFTRIFDPYWGDEGATFAHELASVPTGREDLVVLGGAQDTAIMPVAAAAAIAVPNVETPDSIMVHIARIDLVAAVDLLYAAALRTNGAPDNLAVLGTRASTYARGCAGAPPIWLEEVDNDDELIARLQQEVQSIKPESDVPAISLGSIEEAWDRLREGSVRMRQEIGSFIGKAAWSAMRELLVPAVPRFIGDVLTYLAQRGPGPTPNGMSGAILADLNQASAERDAEDPLIVIAHSFGGVLMYDLLTSLATNVHVDLFCTVGSQVGLFEEMKLYAYSDQSITAAAGVKVPKPANIMHWLNVFDYNDILSFKIEPVFNGVVDYPYPTGALLRAHSEYFTHPSFYQRLADRGRQVLQP